MQDGIEIAESTLNDEEFANTVETGNQLAENVSRFSKEQSENHEEEIETDREKINTNSSKGMEQMTEKLGDENENVNTESVTKCEEEINKTGELSDETVQEVLDKNQNISQKLTDNLVNVTKATNSRIDELVETTESSETIKEDISKAQKELEQKYKDFEDKYIKKDKKGNWKKVKKGGAKELQKLMDDAKEAGIDILKKHPELDEALTSESSKGKTGSKAMMIFKMIIGILALGGVLAILIKVSLMAAALTGCYKYGPTIKDQTGPLDLAMWSKKGFKKGSNDVASNCGCGDITGGGCKNITNKPGIPIPSATECCASDSQIGLLPFCAAGSACSSDNTGGTGCDSGFPGCYGTSGDPKNDFVYYGFQHVSALSLLDDFFKAAANAAGGLPGMIKKIIMYVGIGAGVLLAAYAVFAIIRSFSNKSGGGSSGGKTEIVEVKK